MELDVIGMMYLKAADTLSDSPADNYTLTEDHKDNLSRVRKDLELCAKGMDFIFRIEQYDERAYAAASRLLSVMPNLRDRSDRNLYIKYLAGETLAFQESIHKVNRKELVDFFSELGANYVSAAQAPILSGCEVNTYR